MAVTTDLHITGKVAQFGRGIMGDVSSKLMAQFADNLNQMIDEQGVGSPEATDAAALPPRTPPRAPSDSSTAAETQAKPQVRKIEGPATEPIDLMEVGGSSLVKRIVPALIAIVVVSPARSTPTGLRTIVLASPAARTRAGRSVRGGRARRIG